MQGSPKIYFDLALDIGFLLEQARRMHMERMRSLIPSGFFCVLLSASIFVVWPWHEIRNYPLLLAGLLLALAFWLRRDMLRLLEGHELTRSLAILIESTRSLEQRARMGLPILPQTEVVLQFLHTNPKFIPLEKKTLDTLRSLLE